MKSFRDTNIDYHAPSDASLGIRIHEVLAQLMI